MKHSEFLASLSLTVPVFQAPMAGTSTPAMAAAVSEAGGLGALGLGAMTPDLAAKAIAETQALTDRPINVNFFCYRPSPPDSIRSQAWISRTTPLFEEFGVAPPTELQEIYASFRVDDRMLDVVLAARPAIASFHFGLPEKHQVAALRHAGIMLIASATSLAEAQKIERAGFSAIIAQGWEAGGHRGIFDPDDPDERLSTETLTRLLVRETRLPVIAAGGLMDGCDVQKALGWGAVAAQMGTAFIACPESAADDAYRARLAQGGETVMTTVISGRPARCLSNRFTEWGRDISDAEVAHYPYAYDLGKALNAAAKAAGETGFGAQWSGMAADRALAKPAGEVIRGIARHLA